MKNTHAQQSHWIYFLPSLVRIFRMQDCRCPPFASLLYQREREQVSLLLSQQQRGTRPVLLEKFRAGSAPELKLNRSNMRRLVNDGDIVGASTKRSKLIDADAFQYVRRCGFNQTVLHIRFRSAQLNSPPIASCSSSSSSSNRSVGSVCLS